MKRVGMGLLLLMVRVQWTQAQFLGGIFSQGSTELKNNAAQIVALKALDATNAQGYAQRMESLNNIGDIQGAEYALHKRYFASLEMVNPVITGMPEVAEINIMVTTSIRTLQAAIRRWTASGKLTSAELAAMTALETGQQALAALQTIITTGNLSMTDAERIQAVRSIDAAVKQQYAFLTQACAEGDLLVANRNRL